MQALESRFGDEHELADLHSGLLARVITFGWTTQVIPASNE